MSKTLKFIIVVISMLLIQSCVKDDSDKVLNPDSETETDTLTENEVSLLELMNLQITERFEFKTSEEESIRITDNIPNAKYDIYAYNDTEFIGEEITLVNDEGQPDTMAEYKRMYSVNFCLQA
jgi:hypothetical protein